MVMPKAYAGNEPYIFISYAHKDSAKVIPIIQALQDRGFRVWYDAGIEAGTEWPEYIAEHLDGCTCFLALLSQSALDSHNCRREINFAIELRKDPLAVYLEDVKLSLGMRMQLGTLQAMFYNRHPDQESFIDTLAACELLKPCRVEATAPVSESVPQPVPKTVPKPMPINPSTPAEMYQQGKKLYDKNRYTEAIPLLQRAAEQDHPDAQFQLGWCYFCGNGVTQNMKTAAEWYEKAAELGHAKAQCELAYCYFKGHGVSYNLAEAAKWYQKAAELGFAKAQYELALCYHNGYGVSLDPKEAIHWMQKAAQQKFKNAESLAKSWNEQFSSPEALFEEGKKRYSDLAYQAASELFHKAADAGHVEAMRWLSSLYEHGRGVPASMEKSFYWLEQAAAHGDSGAQAKVAHRYFVGTDGAQMDLSKAIAWAKKAQAQGEDSVDQIANFWNNVPSRQMTAQEVSAKRTPEITTRTPEEMAALGLEHYRSGNYSDAVTWFQKAQKAGNADGTFYLACCYAEGKGVQQDYILAMELYWSLPSNIKTYQYQNPDRNVLLNRDKIVQWYIDTLQKTKKHTKMQIHAFLQRFAEKEPGSVFLLAHSFDIKNLFTPAFILYQAIANHDRPSGFCVAMHYHFGLGVAQNAEEAIKWYLKHKDYNSCACLAVMYEEGHGVRKNWFEAQKWWSEYKKCGGRSNDIRRERDSLRKWAEKKEWNI